jgi:hypothetical protein
VDWLRDHGAVTEASNPYTSGGGTAPLCTTTGHVAALVNVTGWRLVPGNTSADSEAAMMAWLAAYGPVSILVRLRPPRADSASTRCTVPAHPLFRPPLHAGRRNDAAVVAL